MVSCPFRFSHLRKHSSKGRSNTTTSTGIPGEATRDTCGVSILGSISLFVSATIFVSIDDDLCPGASSASWYHVDRCFASKLHLSMIGQRRWSEDDKTCFSFETHFCLVFSWSWLIRQNLFGIETSRVWANVDFPEPGSPTNNIMKGSYVQLLVGSIHSIYGLC